MKNQVFNQVRKSVMILSCILFVATMNSFAQYQLRNSTFDAPFNNAQTGNNGVEPEHWHSFGSCVTNTLTGTAKTGSQISQSSDTRNGVGYSCKVNARNVLAGIIANGTVTTGRMNAGSTTASSSDNHNFTDPNNSNFNEPWTTKPDSIRFWAKFTTPSTTQYARLSAFIHGNAKVSDPLAGVSGSSGQVVAYGLYEWQRGDQGWHQYSVPFDYDSYASNGRTPAYILISFTTNRVAGQGSANDALYIDDIEMVYSAWLADIKANGTTIQGFSKNVFSYNVNFPMGINHYNPAQIPVLTYTKLAHAQSRAVVSENLVLGTNNKIDTCRKVLTVTAEDGNQKIYTVNFIGISSNANIVQFDYVDSTSMTTETVSSGLSIDDNPALHLSITLDAGTTKMPEIQANSIVLSDTSARVTSITQATANNLTATITVTSKWGTTKTYYIHFSVGISDNADLASIDIIPHNKFHSDTTYYHVVLPIGTTVPPVISAVAAWQGLTPVITQATKLPDSVLINVTAEDNMTTKQYIVYLTVHPDTNVNLTAISYSCSGSETRTDVNILPFHPNRTAYNVHLPYGITTVSIDGTTASAVAIKRIDAPAPPPTTLSLTVKAEDTTYTKTYTVTFTVKDGSNNALSSLAIDGYLLYDFDPNVYFYEIPLPYGTVDLPVISVMADDEEALVSVTNITQFGDTATIEVTALNGDIAIYKVLFTVGKNPNAFAKNIFIDNVPLSNFSPTTRNYSYELPMDYEGLPVVSVELDNPNATYQITQITAIPGQARIRITAEDTNSKSTYNINFSQEENGIALYNGNAKIKVYPNPTSGQLTFESGDLVIERIEIYDVVGRKIVNCQLSIINSIDVSHLSNGMYFYKILTDGQQIVHGRFTKN